MGELPVEAQIAYGLEDVLGDRRNDYANRSILLVGGGYSAATTACNIAKLAEDQQSTWAIWLAREPACQPLRRVANDPLRERDRLARAPTTSRPAATPTSNSTPAASSRRSSPWGKTPASA